MASVIVLELGHRISDSYCEVVSNRTRQRVLETSFLNGSGVPFKRQFNDIAYKAETILFVPILETLPNQIVTDEMVEIAMGQQETLIEFWKAQANNKNISVIYCIQSNGNELPWQPLLLAQQQFVNSLQLSEWQSLNIVKFRGEKDLDEGFNSALQTWARKRYHHGSTKCKYYNIEDKSKGEGILEIIRFESLLIGRDQLLYKVGEKLQSEKQGVNVLLWGTGGIGKSMLARQVAYQWAKAKKEQQNKKEQENTLRNVLYLEAGDAGYGALNGALKNIDFIGVHPPLQYQTTWMNGPLITLLDKLNVGLVLLDDCWNRDALKKLRNDINPKIHLLMTAHLNFESFYEDNAYFDAFEILPLDAKDSIKVLTHDLPSKHNLDTALLERLRAEVGDHPLYLNLVAKSLKTQYEADKFDLQIFVQHFRHSEAISQKLDDKLDSIITMIDDDLARKVLHACGAFFARFLTESMLTQYLQLDDPTWSSSQTDAALKYLAKQGLVNLEPQAERYKYISMHQSILDHIYESYGMELKHHEKARHVIDQFHLASVRRSSIDDETLLPYSANLLGMFACCLAHNEDIGGMEWYQYIPRDRLNQTSLALQMLTMMEELARREARRENAPQESAATYAKIGQIYLELQLYDPELQLYDRALESLKEAGHLYKGHSAEKLDVLLNIGKIFTLKAQYDKALKTYEEARQIINQGDFPQQKVHLALAFADCYRAKRQKGLDDNQPLTEDETKAIKYYVYAYDDALKLEDQSSEDAALKVDYLTRVGKGLYSIRLRDDSRRMQALEALVNAQRLVEDRDDLQDSISGCRLCHLGKLCQQLEDYDESIKYLNKALQTSNDIKEFGKLPCHTLALVDTYLTSDHIDKAKEKLGDLLLKPTNLEYFDHDERIQVLETWKEVLKQYKEQQADDEEVQEICEQFHKVARLFVDLGVGVESAWYRKINAEVYVTENKLKEAQEEYFEAIRTAQTHKQSHLTGLLLQQLGQAYQDTDMAQAERYLHCAILSQQDGQERDSFLYGMLWFQLGFVQIKQHKIDQARETFRGAIGAIYDARADIRQFKIPMCLRLAEVLFEEKWYVELGICFDSLSSMLASASILDRELVRNLGAMALQAGLYRHADTFFEMFMQQLEKENNEDSLRFCIELGLEYFNLDKVHKRDNHLYQNEMWHGAKWLARGIPAIPKEQRQMRFALKFQIASTFALPEHFDRRHAENYFRQAIDDASTDDDVLNCHLALVHVYAQVPEYVGKALESLAWVEKLIPEQALTDDNLLSLRQCSIVYQHLGQYESASRCLDRLVSAAQGINDQQAEADAYLQLGKVYRAQGRNEVALEYFKRWHELRIDGDVGCGLCHWAQTCEQLEQYDTAISLLRDAAISSRQYANHHNTLCNERRLGALLMQTDPPQPRQALYHFQQAIRAARRNSEWDALPLLYAYCGDICFRLKKDGAAFRHLKHWYSLREQYPDETENDGCRMCKLGQLYRSRGDNSKAKECLESASEISQRTSEMNVNWGCHLEELATVYELEKQKREALEYLKAARDIFVQVDAPKRAEAVDERIERLTSSKNLKKAKSNRPRLQ